MDDSTGKDSEKESALRVLLIDDDASLLNSLSMLVESLGHEADCAENAERGIAMAEGKHYDIFLVDYLMPDKTGIWFMKHLSAPLEAKRLLMTAYTDRRMINEMFRLGICGYLIKPFDREELAHQIDFHTQGLRSKREKHEYKH